MSEANVELLRTGIAAWNQREVDLWLNYAAPEIEWMPAGPAAVESAVYRGYDEVRKGIEDAWETWGRFEFHESEVRDLVEAARSLGRVTVRGSPSRVAVCQRVGTR